MHAESEGPVSLAWVARAAFIVFGIAVAYWLLGRLSVVLLLFLGAVVVASVLVSTGGLIGRVVPLGRKWCLAIAGVLIVAVLAGFLFLLGSRLLAEFSTLSQQLPAMVETVGTWIGIENPMQKLRSLETSGLIMDAFGYAPGVFAAVTGFILSVFGGVFLAADPERYLDGAARLVPRRHREAVRSALANSGRALRLWLVGKLIAMLVIGVATTGGLLLLGVPSALALGLIAGLFEFVPFIGAVAAFVPAALVALSTGLSTFWWVLALYVVIQQIESNVLVPLIQERTVSLPPVLGLFAIAATGLLFGPLGVVLGVPLTVALLVLVKQLYVRGALGEDVSVPGEGKE